MFDINQNKPKTELVGKKFTLDGYSSGNGTVMSQSDGTGLWVGIDPKLETISAPGVMKTTYKKGNRKLFIFEIKGFRKNPIMTYDEQDSGEKGLRPSRSLFYWNIVLKRAEEETEVEYDLGYFISKLSKISWKEENQ